MLIPVVHHPVWILVLQLIYISPLIASTENRDTAPGNRHRPRTESPCAEIFRAPDQFDLFEAQTAYDCLISVPFNQTIAIQFLRYYKDTLELQSTQAYLKRPPPDYQQPAVDLDEGLDRIEEQVNRGDFHSQYEFERAVQQLILQTHDASVVLVFGILSIFTFGSPLGIVSVSEDGVALPQIYVANDLLEAQGDFGWQASAIVAINDQDVVEYLNRFAAQNVQGAIEPHANWNNLMASPASDIQLVPSTFEGLSLFYPGPNVTFRFKNGTVLSDQPWLAQWSPYIEPSEIPSLFTGQQLYDWFVLGISSTEADATSGSLPSESSTASKLRRRRQAASSTRAPKTPVVSAWPNPAYPVDPIVSQPRLGKPGGGVVTGYVLNDDTTAILSLPSFDMTLENSQSFSQAVADLIVLSKAAGCSRVIVDLQGNTGGNDLLATDTFKQFFPGLDPYDGARMRATDVGNSLGDFYTTYYDTHDFSQSDEPSYEELSASDWVATDYLNAETGQNFTSWADYFGPIAEHGDFFTRVQRDNLSSPVFTHQRAGIVVHGFANHMTASPQPFPARDVIVLTDAYCSGACARFVEMMRTEGSVRTVVAGGRPDTTPMQTVGGNKGAESYTAYDLDLDSAIAFNLDNSNQSFTSGLPFYQDPVDFILPYAGFNLKDALRKGSNVPLQFTYDPADCRIFYTTWTFYNYINLWNYVIDALYRNPSLCIATSMIPPPRPPSSALGALVMKGLSPSPPPSRKTKRFSTNPRGLHQHKPHRRSLRSRNDETSHFTTRSELTPCQKCLTGVETCYNRGSCQLDQAAAAKTVCKRTCSLVSNGPLKCPNNQSCIRSSASIKGACVKFSEVPDCLEGPGSQPESERSDAAPDLTRSLQYSWGPRGRNVNY